MIPLVPLEVIPEWLRPAVARLTDVCVDAAWTELGLRLPPIDAVITAVEPGHEVLRTDYDRSIFLGLSSPDQAFPPPQGTNMVYGLAHEVGHIVLARFIPKGTSLAVVWDESFAHHLALATFFPAIDRALGDTPWPGESAGWQHRQSQLSNENSHFGSQTAQLVRTTTIVAEAAKRLGGERGLLERLSLQAPSKLSLMKIEQTLRGLGRI